MTVNGPQGEARLRIRKLVGWGVFGQINYIISQFILLTVLARFSSVEDVGRFGIVTALLTPIFFFFSLGLRVNQATDIARKYSFNEFLYIRFISTSSAYIVLAAASILFLKDEAITIALVFGAAKSAETFSDLFYGFFQRTERIEYVARSLALRGFGSAILFTAVLVSTRNVALAFLSHCLVWALVAIFVDYLPARRLARAAGDTGPVRFSAIWDLARSSFPLGLNALLSALQGSLPRYVIGWLIGVASLGQFTVVSYAMQSVATLTVAIGGSIASRLAFYYSNGNRHAFFLVFKRFIVIIACTGAFGMLASLLIGDWIIRTVFGPEYSNLGILFAICNLAAALRACVIILESGLFAARQFYSCVILRAFTLVVMFIACLVGTWTGGLVGLSWGMTLSFLFHAVTLWLALRRLQFPSLETKVA